MCHLLYGLMACISAEQHGFRRFTEYVDGKIPVISLADGLTICQFDSSGANYYRRCPARGCRGVMPIR
jgi:hypothetical protein